MAVLGNTDSTTDSWDSFAIPFNTVLSDGNITSSIDVIHSVIDGDAALLGDFVSYNSFRDYQTNLPAQPYASFALCSVPVPAAAWLFGSGLIGLIGIARRKKT